MAVELIGLETRPPLTVEEFYALAEEQGWDEDTRVELLDGEVVWMSPIGDRHAGCVNRLTRLFVQRYPETTALVSIQNPVRPSDLDEPQPDAALLKPRADHYGTAKPTPADILLLVEVADWTLRQDLGRKARIYASAGVPEYWVIDVNHGRLYVHRTPQRGAYRSRTILERGAVVAARFAPRVRFTLDELLG
jgi:Uma2 family endonuclease